MSKNTVAIVNMTDGSVQVHKAGCKDLTRKARGKVQFADEAWELEVDDRRDAAEAYNADFDEETEGWWELTWMPCAHHVPEREESATVETTIKVCGKWTRFYQNGVEVGRVHNDAADAVFALIRQS